MSKPMFFYVGMYDDVADADADYEGIKALHSGKAIGSYDSAIISKEPNGEVKVTKTEKPAHHGGWVGLAAGAGAAVVFPVLLPGVVAAGAAGAGLGAWFGHLAHGTSRREAREMGAMLTEGSAALVVIGIDNDAGKIEQAATSATNHVLKRNVGDWDEAEQEALGEMEKLDKTVVNA
jgi:uncharacterized membrane protein